jgi:hypothetical protein
LQSLRRFFLMMAGESPYDTSDAASAADRCTPAEFAAPQTASQAKFLRVIGQDLEARGIASFSLSLAEDHYRVRGAMSEKRLSVQRPGRFWLRRRAEETAEAAPAEINYSYEDIERLDQSGRAKRGSGGSPDFLSVSQQLRAVGAIVDRKRAQLLRLDRLAGEDRIPSLTIQVRTMDGKPVLEQHSSTNLYDFCVRMYKARKAAQPRRLSPMPAEGAWTAPNPANNRSA